MVLTKNEMHLLSYLWRNYKLELSINGLAKQINVTPKGAYKILQKFEKENLITKRKVANAFIYKLNFDNSKTKDLVKYVLKSEQVPNPYINVLKKNMHSINKITKVTIVFGSVLTKGLRANDIDLLVIINKKNYSELRKEIKDFESICPKKIHLLVQTEQDVKKNLQKNDPVIQEVLRGGHILRGYDLIYKLVENGAN